MLSFAAQGAFARAGFEEVGGNLPHHVQILAGGPVTDPAATLTLGDIEDMMILVLPAAVFAALRLHQPVRPDQISEVGGIWRQAAQIVLIFHHRRHLAMSLAQGLAA